MASDDTVQVQIGVEADELRAGLDDAYDQLGKFGEQASNAFEQMASASAESSRATVEGLRGIQEQLSLTTEFATKLLEVLGAFKAIEWATELVKGGMEAAEQLRNMSEMTGIGLRTMQELKYAATASGIEFTTVAMGVRMLNRELEQMKSAPPGGAREQAFKGLGIDVTQIKGAEDAINKLSEAFQKYGDNAKTVQEVTVAVGGRGAALIPLIRNWQELREAAEASGAVLTDVTINQAAQASEEWNKLGATWDAAKVALAAGLGPALEMVAKLLQDLVGQIIKLEADGTIQRWAQEAVVAFLKLTDSLISVVEWLDKAAEHVRNLTNGFAEAAAGGSGIGGILESVTHYVTGAQTAAAATKPIADGWVSAHNEVEKLISAAEDYKSHIAATTAAHAVGGPGTSGTEGPSEGQSASQIAAAKKAAEERYQAFVEEQRQEIELDGNTTAVKIQHLAEIVAYAKTAFGEHSKEYQRALAEELGAERENMTQLKALYAEELTDASKIQSGGGNLQKDQEAVAFAAHQVTKLQELAFDKQVDDQQYADKLKLYDELAKLYADDQKKLESIATERALEEQKHAQETIKLAQEVAQEQIKQAQLAQTQWAEVLKPVQTEITGGILGILKGESPGAAFSKTAGGILQGGITSTIGGAFTGGKVNPDTGQPTDFAGLISQKLTGQAGGLAGLLGKQFGIGGASAGPEAVLQTAATTFQAAVTQFAAAVGTSSVGAGDGFTDAIDALTSGGSGGGIGGGGIGDIFGAIGSSGSLASLFSSAPEAAGAAGGLADVASLLPFFGFSRGGDVVSAAGGMASVGGDGVLARLHPKEMVLPADVAQTVRDNVGGNGGSTTVNAHMHINAIDSQSFAGHLQKHASAIIDTVGRAVRTADPRVTGRRK